MSQMPAPLPWLSCVQALDRSGGPMKSPSAISLGGHDRRPGWRGPPETYATTIPCRASARSSSCCTARASPFRPRPSAKSSPIWLRAAPPAGSSRSTRSSSTLAQRRQSSTLSLTARPPNGRQPQSQPRPRRSAQRASSASLWPRRHLFFAGRWRERVQFRLRGRMRGAEAGAVRAAAQTPRTQRLRRAGPIGLAL
jgi:hypothetical protein